MKGERESCFAAVDSEYRNEGGERKLKGKGLTRVLLKRVRP